MMSWLQTRLLRTVAIAALSVGFAETAGADCSLTSTGMVPLNDLGMGTYQGDLGGLYPNGQNNPLPAHLSAGINIATQIKPLDASGPVNLANGKIVLISVGMSNTQDEFDAFLGLAIADPAKNPQLVIVNGAQASQTASRWADPKSTTWTNLNSRLAAAGVTPEQVQVAWVKEAESHPASLGAFPVHAQVLQSDLEAIARNLTTKYPNIKIAYFSSRTRSYTNDPTTLNPEPFAYESAFSVRWTIQDQLDGVANLNFDPNQGPVVAPWMAWGPYLWADGTNPRSDGFVWLCSDLQADFTHPSPSGQDKVADELLAFFKTHPTATPWFLRSTVIGQPPTASATAMPTNGVAPLAVNFSATASDPGGTITQYAWTYDDGDFSFAQNPTKTFPAPGSYNVRLAVEDNSGNSVVNVVPITVTTGSPPIANPILLPPPGDYYNAGAYYLFVGMACSTPNSQEYFTTDGSTPAPPPTAHGTNIPQNAGYAGGFAARNSPVGLNVVAFQPGLANSNVVSGTYTIHATPDSRTQIPDPQIGPAAGSYQLSTTQTQMSFIVATAIPGAAIRYTLDGSTPTTGHGTLINQNVGRINFSLLLSQSSKTFNLQVIAYGLGKTPSNVKTFTITLTR